MGVLEDKVILNDTGEEQSLMEFFNDTWTKAPEQKRTAKDLLIALLQQTGLQDVVKAQQSVHYFLRYKERHNTAIVPE